MAWMLENLRKLHGRSAIWDEPSLKKEKNFNEQRLEWRAFYGEGMVETEAKSKNVFKQYIVAIV